MLFSIGIVRNKMLSALAPSYVILLSFTISLHEDLEVHFGGLETVVLVGLRHARFGDLHVLRHVLCAL